MIFELEKMFPFDVSVTPKYVKDETISNSVLSK